MQKLYILSGLSHSGKSYLAQAISDKTKAVIVSLDQINKERGFNNDEVIPVEEWENTHAVALEKLDLFLSDGKTVIVDDTNPLKMIRMRFKSVADKHNIKTVIIYLDTPDEILEERIKATQESKGRHLAPKEALDNLKSFFELPTEEECEVVTYKYGEDLEEWLGDHFYS